MVAPNPVPDLLRELIMEVGGGAALKQVNLSVHFILIHLFEVEIGIGGKVLIEGYIRLNNVLMVAVLAVNLTCTVEKETGQCKEAAGANEGDLNQPV